MIEFILFFYNRFIYNFEIVFNYNEKNWRTPDLFINDIGIYFLWKDINPKTLDEFFEVEYRDCGEEWEQNGFAQKIWVLCPATDWYSRFKDRIKI